MCPCGQRVYQRRTRKARWRISASPPSVVLWACQIIKTFSFRFLKGRKHGVRAFRAPNPPDRTTEPLLMYPLVEKLLADVPFGRFFASSHLGALSDLPSGRVVALSIYPFAMFSLAMYPLADVSFPPTWVPFSIYFLAYPSTLLDKVHSHIRFERIGTTWKTRIR